jgi:hypothetical protein
VREEAASAAASSRGGCPSQEVTYRPGPGDGEAVALKGTRGTSETTMTTME